MEKSFALNVEKKFRRMLIIVLFAVQSRDQLQILAPKKIVASSTTKAEEPSKVETASQQNAGTNKPYNENADPNMVTSTKLFYKNMFIVNKRMGRADYWRAFVGNAIIAFLVSFFYGFITGMSPSSDAFECDSLSGEPTGPTVALFILLGIIAIYSIIVFIAGMTAQMRGLHDMGLSAAYRLISIILIIGSIALLIMLLQPSKQVNNPYI